MAAGLWSLKSPHQYWVTSRNSASPTSSASMHRSGSYAHCRARAARRAVFLVGPRAPDWTWRLAADPAASPQHRRVLERDGLKGGAAGADAGDLRRAFPSVKLSALEGDGRDRGWCADS